MFKDMGNYIFSIEATLRGADEKRYENRKVIAFGTDYDLEVESQEMLDDLYEAYPSEQVASYVLSFSSDI